MVANGAMIFNGELEATQATLCHKTDSLIIGGVPAAKSARNLYPYFAGNIAVLNFASFRSIYSVFLMI